MTTGAEPTVPSGVNFDFTVSSHLNLFGSLYSMAFSETDNIPAAAVESGSASELRSVVLDSDGVTIWIGGISTRDDLIPAVETGWRMTITTGSQTLEVQAASDTSDPYTVDNIPGYAAFFNALVQNAAISFRFRYP